MNKTHLFRFAIFFVGFVLVVQACESYRFRSNYTDVDELLQKADSLGQKPYLKAHLRNGDVYVLKDSWEVDTTEHLITGRGVQYDFNREKVFEGDVVVPVDSVLVFETNASLENLEANKRALITVFVVLNTVVAMVCLSNPKSCFGSCPTFYIDKTDNVHDAVAEGFSHAISPSMEDADVDALGRRKISDCSFFLTMKNEALETHCVNHIRLLAYPLERGERVYQSPDGEYYLCENVYPLAVAKAPEGEVTSLLRHSDKRERFSLADEKKLSSKEEVFLTFDGLEQAEDLGLVLHFRQTLMTTYFIYSALDYMGDEVGAVFAEIERSGHMQEQVKSGLKAELGDVDVYLWSTERGEWIFQGGFYETGPIAINRQLLPLSSTVSKDGRLEVKVVLNKGLWRIDYVALAGIKSKVSPIELEPDRVLQEGRIDDFALEQINTSDRYLINMPGGEYDIHFTLPEAEEDQYYELFLYAQGYYWEWMRESWMKDKDLHKLRQMLEKPQKYLKTEAKAYKHYEREAEQMFWNSRINSKIFSYE